MLLKVIFEGAPTFEYLNIGEGLTRVNAFSVTENSLEFRISF